MSRDMKPPRRQAQPARKKSGGGTLVGMFIGLVLGVGIAAGVVWYLNKSPLPFANKVPLPTRADNSSAANGQPAQPMALPGKPGDPVPEKRFQFYDILPGKSEAAPDKGAQPPKPESPQGRAEEGRREEGREKRGKEGRSEKGRAEGKQDAAVPPGRFPSAPRRMPTTRRPSWRFMGVEAVVQQVMVQDKTYYRVRVGPYPRIEDVNKVRAELARSGIDAQLAK